jgi:hypothetical protein
MKTTIYILRYFGRNGKNTAKNGPKSIELIYVKNSLKRKLLRELSVQNVNKSLINGQKVSTLDIFL